MDPYIIRLVLKVDVLCTRFEIKIIRLDNVRNIDVYIRGVLVDTLSSEENGCRFADDIFTCMLLNTEFF